VIASADAAAAGPRRASIGFIDMEMESWVVVVRDTGAWKAEAQATLATRSLAIIAAKGDGGDESIILDPS
jgi:hypothetical protein